MYVWNEPIYLHVCLYWLYQGEDRWAAATTMWTTRVVHLLMLYQFEYMGTMPKYLPSLFLYVYLLWFIYLYNNKAE